MPPLLEPVKTAQAGGRILRLTVEYDGTDFAGFQLQGKGERTVQGALETAITRATGETVRVHGAGRTDAGVHATGQVVHFETGWVVPPAKAAIALREFLPRDVAVRESREAEPGFHARFSATGRRYRYAILNRTQPSALLGRFALHRADRLDVDVMGAVAAELTGVHDWATFGVAAERGQSTVRHVWLVDVRRWRGCVFITVEGNAFLRQMVRAFVGTLLLAGQGRLTPEGARRLREARERRVCPKIAPPHGLCLLRVRYDGTRTHYDEQIIERAGG